MKKLFYYNREDYAKVQRESQKNNIKEDIFPPTFVEIFCNLFNPGPPAFDESTTEVRKIIHEYMKCTVLEIGCKRAWLAGWFKKEQYTGIDLNKDLVNWAKGKGRNCIVMDMEDLLFENNKFDVVYFKNMEHCNNPRKAALDAKRVCVDGGLILAKAVLGKRDNKAHLWEFNEGNLAGLLTPIQVIHTEVRENKRRGCKEDVVIGWNARVGAPTHKFVK